jgi:anti-sigma B factor antagonist
MPSHLADHVRAPGSPSARGGPSQRNLSDGRRGPMSSVAAARVMASAAEQQRRPLPRVHELHVGRRHVLSFLGELDIATAPLLDGAIAGAIERGAGEVWVDLRQTTFMDSSGVHCLMRAKQTLSQLNRGFAVVCDGDPVRRVLALTGTDRVIATYRDRAAAHKGM